MPTLEEQALLDQLFAPTDQNSQGNGVETASARTSDPEASTGGVPPGGLAATPTYSDEPDDPTQPTVTDRPMLALRRQQQREIEDLERLKRWLPSRPSPSSDQVLEEDDPIGGADNSYDGPLEPAPVASGHPPGPAGVELERWMLALLVGLSILAGVGVAFGLLTCGIVLRMRT